MVSQPITPVAPNNTTSFQVRFDPSVAGTGTATITIANNDIDENPYEFAIQGTGLNQAPIADAGLDQNVNTNVLVNLDGSSSSDPDNNLPLTYGWNQIGGPAVTLSDPTDSQPAFTAPPNPAVLTFTLTVTDSLGLVDRTPDIVVITVNNSPVSQVSNVFLPLILKDILSSPDLVVESLNAGSSNVTVVIKNIGNGPVTDAFWVDVYLDPTTPPTTVNQHWHDVGAQGLVWGVPDAALPLAPGQSLTLTIGDAYYFANLSNFTQPLPAGSPVYAQVDSVNMLTDYGGVLESHEISGEPYNNILQAVSSAGLNPAYGG